MCTCLHGSVSSGVHAFTTACAAPPPPLARRSRRRRLEQAVVSSRLWLEPCQALQPPLPDAVPLSFSSLQHYVDVFEPLLAEEAAESIRSGFEEAERGGRNVSVGVQA